MSIKGITQELFVGKTKVSILNLIGNTSTLAYADLNKIEYDFASKSIIGRMVFYKKTNEKILFKFNSRANDQILKMIDFLANNVPVLPVLEIGENTGASNKLFKCNQWEPKQEIGRYTKEKLNEASELSQIINYTTDEKESNFDSVIPTELRGTLDIYFEQAARFLIKKGKASPTMLQREYKMGFNRAARMIDQLEQFGVVGKEIGRWPRKILMSLEEFEIIIKDFCNTGQKHEGNIRNDISNKEEIQNRINMYNNKYDYMEGHDFEYFCADLLKQNGFSSVEVTSGSGDQGIDIIACKDGVKYGIQCKCYSSDIGNKAVQEAFSGAKFYDCHVPAVLTNRFFTKSAEELAKKNNVLLWGRGYLDKLIESTNNV